jgi:chromate reductase, NAD(P)H dehydrogenase (quinone)
VNIVAFAASSSTKSINKKLVSYAANLVNDASVEILDLNDYELPLFSEDKEAEIGKPELAKQFLEKLGSNDAIMISFAEHNGSYTAAFKNLFDWCSRINPKVYQNKPMVLLATSPGARGAATILSIAIDSMSHFSGDVKGSFSLPSFYDNFDVKNNEISDEELASKLREEVEKLYS